MIAPSPGLCNNLRVTWTPPTNTADGLPVYYKLFLNEDYKNPHKVTDNITSIMGNLTANTEYTVTVVAVNELGKGGNVTGSGRTGPEGLNNVMLLMNRRPFV